MKNIWICPVCEAAFDTELMNPIQVLWWRHDCFGSDPEAPAVSISFDPTKDYCA
jgi:hypothetical protein